MGEEQRKSSGGKLHCGFASGWILDVSFPILLTAGVSSFQIKIAIRKIRLYLCLAF